MKPTAAHLLLALALLLAAAFVAVAQDASDSERRSFWQVPVNMYDSEGRAGIATGPISPSGSKHYVYIGDFVDIGQYWAVGGDIAYPNGTPILFRAESPLNAPFAGYTTVGQNLPSFLAPVPASQVPYELHQRPTTDCQTREKALVLDIRVYMADDTGNEKATIGLPWDLFNVMQGRSVGVRVDYLEGNTLHDHGFDEAVLPGVGGEFNIGVLWGEYSPPTNPSRTYFGPDIPEGPALVSFSVDGYTTDTLLVEFENCQYTRWVSKVAPDYSNFPGPSPSQLLLPWMPLPPAPIILERSGAWQALGICEQFSNIEPYMDGNEDNVRDVADIVRAMTEAK